MLHIRHGSPSLRRGAHDGRQYNLVDIAELVLKYLRTLAWPAVAFGAIWTLRTQLRAAVARVTRVETLAGSIEFAAEVREVLNQAESAADADQPPNVPVPPPWGQPQYPSAPGPAPPAPVEEPAYRPQPSGPTQSDRRYRTPPYGPAAPQPRTPQNEPPPFPAQQPSTEGQSPWPSGYGYPQPYAPSPAQPVARGGPNIRADASRPSPRLQALRDLRDTADNSPTRAIVEAWDILYGICNDVIASFEVNDPHTQFPGRRNAAVVVRRLVSLGLRRESVTVFARLQDLRNRAAHLDTSVTPVAARDFIDSCLALAREVEALTKR